MKQVTILLIFGLLGNIFAKGDDMQISVNTVEGKSIVFALNKSDASKELAKLLPLKVKVENFGGNEKIFYPPKKLPTSNTPIAKNGTLAYYAPWGDVVMFYENYNGANGLYELGSCIKGCEHIKELNGEINIRIEK